MRSIIRATAVTAALGGIGAVACSVTDPTEHGGSITSAVTTSTSRFYEGVGETVTLLRRSASDPMPYKVQRKNGTFQRYSDFLETERVAYRVRFGALTPRVRTLVAGLRPDQRIPVAIYFELDTPWSLLEPGLRSKVATVRDGARTTLRSAIVRSGATLTSSLSTAGIPIRRVMETVPVAYAELTAAQINALAKNPAVATVRSNERGFGRRHYNQRDLVGTPNTASYVATDSEFNALGFFARGQKVGIVESAECRLFSEHDAFQFSGAPSSPKVMYEVSPRSCTVDGDCGVCDGIEPAAGNHRCVSGQCVVGHASSVASVVSASNDGVRNAAAEAQLFYPNRGHQGPGDPYPNVFCSDEGTADAYEWMVNQGVRVANESYGCFVGVPGHENEFDGVHEDYYARNYGISITKAAGNNALYAACPDTLNSLCVGGTRIPGDYSYAESAWRNPDESDREEPDIMALGAGPGPLDEGPTVATIVASNLWEDGGGTSFAAPAVAAQIALLRDACGGDLDERFVRAVMEASAYYINPDQDDGFSIPGTGDWRDGAGVAGGAQLLDFCGINRTANVTFAETRPVDITGDGDPLEPNPVDFPKDPPPSGFRGLELHHTLLKHQEKIRAVITWDACTIPAGSKAFVKTDFDLLLVNKGTGQIVKYSASVLDNDEGFQFTAPADGDYGVLLIWPNGSVACGSPIEQIGIAVVHGDNLLAPGN